MKKKIRKISSVSDVITNSSTQVFIMDYDNKLKKIIKTNNLGDILHYKNFKEIREILLKGLEANEISWTQQTKEQRDQVLDYRNCCEFLSYLYPVDGFFEEYGIRTDQDWNSTWSFLNKIGHTNKEILEFLLPDNSELEKDIIKNAIYSYSDDCGYPTTAEILHKCGYNSGRSS